MDAKSQLPGNLFLPVTGKQLIEDLLLAFRKKLGDVFVSIGLTVLHEMSVQFTVQECNQCFRLQKIRFGAF